ncbi:MAG: flagellar basal body protein FliL [Desulfobulbus propionicus]|nr:MAG: flagellar basal body protein FliL [Desulfobulbus propionicus]
MTTTTDRTGEQEGGKKTLLIIIITVILVAVIGGTTAFYVLIMKKPLTKEKGQVNKQVQVIQNPPVDNTTVGPMVNIEQLVVNIISQDTPHYVKAALSLEMNNEQVVEEASKRMPQIRDAVLLLLGNKTFEELQDIQGKKQVKAEVKSKINSFLTTGQVKNIYLTDFVVQ